MSKLKLLAVLFVIGLSGCSSKPPKQSQPFGDLQPVYENQFNINERE